MAEESLCSSESIQKFIVENGGKVTNHALVKHFKKFLSGPTSHPDARNIFKDYVNAVATVKQEDGVKVVVLKKRGCDTKSESSFDQFDQSQTYTINKIDAKKCKLSNDSYSTPRKSDSIPVVLHSHSSPSFFETPIATGSKSTSPILYSSDFPPGTIPQAPPRRKHSVKGKENRSALYEECIRQKNEEKEMASPRDDNAIQGIVSPGSVKEKAQALDKMAESGVLARSSSGRRCHQRQQAHHDDKITDGDDLSSSSSIDSKIKVKWVVTMSKCEYHEMVHMLREEPRLACVKDFNKYTPLHWASKHGKLDVIKLFAGTHKLDINARTCCGFTPLHLAAMFGHEEIMEILINTYGADAKIRDYNGKRPLTYLAPSQAERFVSMFPQLAHSIFQFGKHISCKSEKEPGLMRMGSLNSKVKKPSVLLASGRAITRMKSWGSADNIQDKMTNLMPPPKTFPKKKKSRKHADVIGISENWRPKSGDSDSDSASAVFL